MYLGFFASAIHSRSMLQARTGMWGYCVELQVLPRFPLVRSTSMMSWRLVSHLIGSPNRTTAAEITAIYCKCFKMINAKNYIHIHTHTLIVWVNIPSIGRKPLAGGICKKFNSEYDVIYTNSNKLQYHFLLTPYLGLLLWSTTSNTGYASLSISIVTTSSKPRLTFRGLKSNTGQKAQNTFPTIYNAILLHFKLQSECQIIKKNKKLNSPPKNLTSHTGTAKQNV